MSDNEAAKPVIRHADTETTLGACFSLIQQLRPHLTDPDDFLCRVERMAGDHYRILAIWQGDQALALAGYRLQENLIYGRFLYVDDLITHESARRRRFGARLLEELTAIATQADCVRLVLDTGLANSLAHRFYCRQGLLTGALRFSKALTVRPA